MIALAPGGSANEALDDSYRRIKGNGHDELMEWIHNFQKEVDEMTIDLNTESWKLFSHILDGVLGVDFCSFSKVTKVYESAENLRKYIKSDDYASSSWVEGCPDPTTLKNPRLHMALIMNKLGVEDGVWDYSIQTNMSIIPATYPDLGYINKVDAGVDDTWNDMYMMSGFLSLQLMTDRYIMNRKVDVDDAMEKLAMQQFCDSLDPFVQNFKEFNETIDPKIEPFLKNFSCMKTLDRAVADLGLSTKPLTEPMSYIPNEIRVAEFPTEDYTDREFYLKIENVFALILILTFLWPVSRLVRGLVHEKETRIREGMRMMGLNFAPLYAAWFITYGMVFFLIALLIAVVSSPHLFSRSDPSLIFVFFFLFGLDIIGYCFLISVMFNKAKTASKLLNTRIEICCSLCRSRYCRRYAFLHGLLRIFRRGWR